MKGAGGRAAQVLTLSAQACRRLLPPPPPPLFTLALDTQFLKGHLSRKVSPCATVGAGSQVGCPEVRTSQQAQLPAQPARFQVPCCVSLGLSFPQEAQVPLPSLAAYHVLASKCIWQVWCLVPAFKEMALLLSPGQRTSHGAGKGLKNSRCMHQPLLPHPPLMPSGVPTIYEALEKGD